jgi:predicted transport protein
MTSSISEVFNRYDQFIMSIDEKVTKLIAKHYIAYKYDYSNFVEIIVYKKRNLIINDFKNKINKI